jgi:hypothetical protein
VSDYRARFDEARRWLSQHLKRGQLRQKLHILNGLEQAPEGLQMLFMSANFGKLIVDLQNG